MIREKLERDDREDSLQCIHCSRYLTITITITTNIIVKTIITMNNLKAMLSPSGSLRVAFLNDQDRFPLTSGHLDHHRHCAIDDDHTDLLQGVDAFGKYIVSHEYHQNGHLSRRF